MAEEKKNSVYDEEEGIRLSRIFKVGFHHYVILIIITALVCVVGTIVWTLIGKKSEKYTSEFTYSIPTVKVSTDGKLTLADGNVMDYSSLISETNLTSIKNSSDDFKSINVSNLVNSTNTTITISVDEKTSRVTYTLNFPKNSFTSFDQAKKFMNEVAYTPETYNKDVYSTNKYDAFSLQFDNYYTYDEKIDALVAQYTFLDKKYQDLITAYGGESLVKISDNNYASLNSIYSTFTTQKTNNEILLKNAKTVATTNGYSVKVDGEFPEATLLESEQANLTKRNNEIDSLIKAYNDEIKDIVNAGGSQIYLDTILNNEISPLIVEKNQNTLRLTEINDKLGTGGANIKEATTEYIASLNNLKTTLVEDTSSFKTYELALLEEKSNVSFTSSSVITTTNGISLIKNVGITLVAGLAVGFIVNLIIDRKYLKEEYPSEIAKKEAK